MTSISRPKGNISSVDMIDNWHTKGHTISCYPKLWQDIKKINYPDQNATFVLNIWLLIGTAEGTPIFLIQDIILQYQDPNALLVV